MNRMLLSCVKATELTEMKQHIPLSMVKSIQLHLHATVCSGCKNYMKQSRIIDELLQRKFNGLAIIENTDELESAIISKIL
ncbi:hypothetical protein [Daejeonella sp.]|uniref:hypothetical protein n=1 Tax=Daejeonella sp. TaxID=2805397 RepID=UPI0030BAF283